MLSIGELDPNAIVFVSFRIVALLVGALFVVLGYKLFKLGYFEKAGELKAAWGSKQLILKQTAPGVFFAFFGAFVVAIGIWKPISFSGEGTPAEVTRVLAKFVQKQQVTDAERAVVLKWLKTIEAGRSGRIVVEGPTEDTKG